MQRNAYPRAEMLTTNYRLHMVEMPDLKMGPIYWDPVHDVSSVVRGTWFYKDSMLPVEPDLANQLEEGYEYIKPWRYVFAELFLPFQGCSMSYYSRTMSCNVTLTRKRQC